MPAELLAAVPQLAAIVEKAGIIGILLIVVAWLVYDRMRLTKELRSAYMQRDRWRLACVKYKAACDQAHITVDTADLADLIESNPA